VTPQEDQLLNSLIDRLNQTTLEEKDPDAEALLNERLAGNPDALYMLAQTVLVQNIALDQARAQLSQLQQQIQQQRPQPAHSTSFLGRLLGQQLAVTKRFDDVDFIIPLPLNDKKLFRRGYNQASVIARGINSVWHRSIIEDAVERVLFTETQTHKDRIGRWKTMEGVFTVTQPGLLKNKHVLLVDDIITTGATLEACGEAILKIPGTKLSVATIAYTI